MKQILFVVLLMAFISPAAMADSSSQAISDGMTVTAIQNALARNINGSNITVTDYSKSWNSYNPMSWVIDPNSSYRNISFEFTDSQGQKQKFTCQAQLKRTDTNFFIYNCSNSNSEGRALRYFNRLFQYGNAEDSVIMENIVNRPSSEKGNSTRAVQ